MRRFIDDYNVQVDRHKRDKDADFPEHIRWSSRLKECLARGQYGEFGEAKIKRSLYRPFTSRWVFLDGVVNQRTGKWLAISGRTVAVPGPGNRKPFGTLMSDTVMPLDLAFEKIQCFPLSHLKDAAVAQFRQHYSNNSLTKQDVFHYLYALLHQPAYRERYATNLKRELPRIPFAPTFEPFVTAGKELARVHVEYESAEPWPLQFVEDRRVPYSERVTKMKLSADRQSLRVNESLTLTGIPPEAFDYCLGSRSALEWVIDQYQIKGESDPNREDEPGYIVRLVGQVIEVSVSTVRIVGGLPDYR